MLLILNRYAIGLSSLFNKFLLLQLVTNTIYYYISVTAIFPLKLSRLYRPILFLLLKCQYVLKCTLHVEKEQVIKDLLSIIHLIAKLLAISS